MYSFHWISQTSPLGGLLNFFVNLRINSFVTEGGPLPEPKSGLSSNTQKWIVWGDTHADIVRDFIGKGCLGGEQQVREPRTTALPQGLQYQVSWWWVRFWVVLASHLAWSILGDSGSFLVVRVSLHQDEFKYKRFWEVGRIYNGLACPPPSSPSQILLG